MSLTTNSSSLTVIYAIVIKTILSKHFVNQHPTSPQTSHILHPTSRISHIPNILHPEHPTSWQASHISHTKSRKSLIPNIPHLKYPTSPTSHILASIPHFTYFIPNIPHPEHPIYQTPHISIILHPKHPTSPASHIPHFQHSNIPHNLNFIMTFNKSPNTCEGAFKRLFNNNRI